jgi:hypothetical protein
MIKIYHEAPKSIFKEVQKITDGDYALVHLMEEDPEYLALFKQAKEAGREIILDNSIFELEEAFDAEKFAGWVLELKPDWYIVPDALEDTKKTVQQMTEWNNKHKNLPGKKIGVVQGKTYEQIKTCYEYMDKIANVDMIAISFDYSYYTQTFPHPNKLVSWCMGRVKLLGDLLRDGIINEKKKHHLLGCSIALEFSFYSDYKWIYSLDTSNPVVAGIKGTSYGEMGLWHKDSQKLFELINYPADKIDLNKVQGNIHKFNWLVNGKKI